MSREGQRKMARQRFNERTKGMGDMGSWDDLQNSGDFKGNGSKPKGRTDYSIGSQEVFRHYGRVPRMVIEMNDLPAFAFRLFVYISDISGMTSSCWRSIDTMARELGVDRRTIIRAKKQLVDRRLIVVTEKESSNGEYIYHDISIPLSVWVDNQEWVKRSEK